MLPKWSVIKQVIKEFWIATVLAIAVASYKVMSQGGEFIPLFGGAFVFFYFLTAAYVRISRHQSQEHKLGNLSNEIASVQKIVGTLAKDVIRVGESEGNSQVIKPLLGEIASSTLQANLQMEKAQHTISSFGRKDGAKDGTTQSYFQSPNQMSDADKEKLLSFMDLVQRRGISPVREPPPESLVDSFWRKYVSKGS